MKKITAYINTVRVHWLVQALESIGIPEIMVTEYFSPSSKISRMELVSRDEDIPKVREIIHRIGTTGQSGDHSFFVEEYDPSLPGLIPLGKRTSKLEESRVKQLINLMLRGSNRTIRTSFLAITLSVVVIALFIWLEIGGARKSATDAVHTVQTLYETTGAAENAILEEMLAVERFHRGEPLPALGDFQHARLHLTTAVSGLRKMDSIREGTIDSLDTLEHQFHRIAGGMFATLDSLKRHGHAMSHTNVGALSKSHNQIMASLDELRLHLLDIFSNIVGQAQDFAMTKQVEMNQRIEHVMLSLLVLVGGAIALTVMIWLVMERNVSRPIRKLVDESKVVDTHILKGER